MALGAAERLHMDVQAGCGPWMVVARGPTDWLHETTVAIFSTQWIRWAVIASCVETQGSLLGQGLSHLIYLQPIDCDRFVNSFIKWMRRNNSCNRNGHHELIQSSKRHGI